MVIANMAAVMIRDYYAREGITTQEQQTFHLYDERKP